MRIHGFRNSAPVLKMHYCYEDTQKFRATFHFRSSDTSRLQCIDVNKPLQKVFKRVHIVYTYSNCMIHRLL